MNPSLVLSLLLAVAPVPKAEKVKAEEVTPALAALATRPAVQRELGLSAEERVTLIEGLEEVDSGFIYLLRRLNGGPQPFHCFPTQAEITAKRTEEHAARAKLVAAALSKQQFVRLQQLEVQALGGRAIQLKRVADALTLTDEQKKAVVVGKAADRLTDRIDKLAAVIDGLTPVQRKVWESLKGEKAELKVLWSAYHAEEVERQLDGVERVEESPPSKPDPLPIPDPVPPGGGK